MQTRVEFAELRALVPVEFDDPVVGDVPGPQVRADAERHEELGPLGAGQLLDGVDVEVVVVVVADDHRVDRGQRLQRRRDRMQALRPDRARRRAPVAPHRVGEHAVAVDLDDRRRVPVPGDGEIGGGAGSGSGVTSGIGRGRMLAGAAADDLAEQQELLLAASG